MNGRRQVEGHSSAAMDIDLIVISEGDRSQDDVSGNHRTVSIFKIIYAPRSCKNKHPFHIDEKIFA